MNKLYKTYFFTICLILGLSVLGASAQETIPVKEPEKVKKIENSEAEKWEKWGQEFDKKFNGKEWVEWAKKFELIFDCFGQKMNEIDFANVEFKEKIEKVSKSLQEVRIPELPPIPPIPPLPPLPSISNIEIEINNHRNWNENAVIKTKKLTKSYPATNDDLLLISNSYGKILVTTWDKNEVKVDVEIKVTADSDDKAEKLLDAVNITNGKTANQISFKTVIEKQESGNSWMSSSFWNGGGSNNGKTEIYYTVYMPSKMAVNFKTNYTNIELPNMSGNITLAMNYGDLRGNNLTGKVNVRTNYTKVQFLTANDVTLSCNYGSVRMENVSDLNGNLNYCSANIGSLSGTSTLSMNYSGGFKINSLAKDFKTLNINSNYSSISLGFEDNSAFNFDVRTTYASLSYNENVTITEKTPAEGDKSWSNSKTYKGYYGKSPQGNIIIKSNYGGIKFN
jgi:hypothetical protein